MEEESQGTGECGCEVEGTTGGDFLFDVHFSNLVSERQSSKVQSSS